MQCLLLLLFLAFPSSLAETAGNNSSSETEVAECDIAREGATRMGLASDSYYWNDLGLSNEHCCTGKPYKLSSVNSQGKRIQCNTQGNIISFYFSFTDNNPSNQPCHTCFIQNNPLDPLLLLKSLESLTFDAPSLGNLAQITTALTIPKDIGKLTNLTELSLTDNGVGGWLGSLPESLSDLVNLKRLFISGHGFLGSIPTRFHQLVNMENLYIGDPSNSNGLIGFDILNGTLEFMTSMPNLTSIRIGGTQITSLPSTFSKNPKLQSIDLDGNLLSGTIPTDIGSLTSLTYLSLQRNVLTGPIPASIGNCGKLITLQLDSNKLSGSLPSEVGSLSNLKTLTLSRNLFSGAIPSSFGNLRSLTDSGLDFSFNMFTTFPAGWFSLPSLNTLLLSNNQLISIPAVPDLNSVVTRLDFSNNLIQTIPLSLSKLSRLEVLILSSNRLSGEIPSIFTNMSNFSSLRLSDNQFHGSLPPFAAGVSISIFDLSKNNFAGTFIDLGAPSTLWERLISFNISHNAFHGNFPSLAIGQSAPTLLFDISYNLFSGSLSGPIPFVIFFASHNMFNSIGKVNISQSVVFDIGHNFLEGELPDDVFTGATNLNYVDVSSNMFSSTLPPSLANLTDLLYLNMSNNQFHGPLLAEFGDSLMKLQALLLFESLVTEGAGFFEVGIGYPIYNYIPLSNINATIQGTTRAMPKLAIDLSSNHLSGAIPANLGHIEYLVVLNLGNNSFTGSIPQSFSNFNYIEDLDLSRNQFVGYLDTLAQLVTLSTLYLNDNFFIGTFDSFQSLSFLQSLDLANTLITGPFHYPNLMPLNQECILSSRMCINGTQAIQPTCTSLSNPNRITKSCSGSLVNSTTITILPNGTVQIGGLTIQGATADSNGNVVVNGTVIFPPALPVPNPPSTTISSGNLATPTPQPPSNGGAASSSTVGGTQTYTVAAIVGSAFVLLLVGGIALYYRTLQRKNNKSAASVAESCDNIEPRKNTPDLLSAADSALDYPTSITLVSELFSTGTFNDSGPSTSPSVSSSATKQQRFRRSLLFGFDLKLQGGRIDQHPDFGDVYLVSYSGKDKMAKVSQSLENEGYLHKEAEFLGKVKLNGALKKTAYFAGVMLADVIGRGNQGEGCNDIGRILILEHMNLGTLASNMDEGSEKITKYLQEIVLLTAACLQELHSIDWVHGAFDSTAVYLNLDKAGVMTVKLGNFGKSFAMLDQDDNSMDLAAFRRLVESLNNSFNCNLDATSYFHSPPRERLGPYLLAIGSSP